MKRILLKNADYVLTMNEKREVLLGADILIEGNVIKEIGMVDETKLENVEVINARGKVIMPGLINTHVHLNQQLGRGIADDVNLLTWLRKRIWPYESSMSPEDTYISSLACASEMIRSGVTSFAEAGGSNVDSMVKAISEIGIRGAISRTTMDDGDGLPEKWQETTDELLDAQVEHYKKWNNTSDDRIKVWFCLRTIFNNSDKLISRTKELADKYNTGIHMHIAEVQDENDYVKATRGTTTVEHLNNLGILGENLLAVHTVWLTDREIDLFRLHDVKVSHCPSTAMKILGFARIPEMKQKGITVSLGTDGAPANNQMNMMRDIYTAAVIHKARTQDMEIIPAQEVIEMATINGARAMNMEQEVGSLEIGKKADLIIMNPKGFNSYPVHDIISNIVYSMDPRNIESSMCNGEWVMKDSVILNIDEMSLLEEVKERGESIVKRAGIQLPNRFPYRQIR